MLEVLGQDYIKSTKSRGLPTRRIIWPYALRNAMPPALTLMGLQLGTLVGGAVPTETIFAYPGVGRLILAVPVDAQYAEELGIKVGAPVLRATQITTSGRGEILAYGVTLNRTDVVRLRISR